MTSFVIQLLVGCFIISTVYYWIKDIRTEKIQQDTTHK